MLVLPAAMFGQEKPYFVTYDHYLEEPGNLEIAANSAFATQHTARNFSAYWTELEYGVTGWYTTEFYLDGQTTLGDSTVFTGYRWENRFRPLKREHWINPVLYVEFENVNGADKTMREIVGHDAAREHAEPNALLRAEREREIELKLILSSSFKGWNVSENILAVKNLANEPWEFGYALGVSRPLALKASVEPCTFCRENFTAGAELYGGLGDRYSFGLRDTSHYLSPVLAWNLPSGTTLRISPGFGLNDNSHGFVLRWGVSHELSGFARTVGRLFGRKP